MAKREKKPTWTVQTKVVLVADVEVEADTLEDAIALGKTWKLRDVISLDEAATEGDSKVTILGAYSQESWGTD